MLDISFSIAHFLLSLQILTCFQFEYSKHHYLYQKVFRMQLGDRQEIPIRRQKFKQIVQRIKFTPEEDNRIKELVRLFGVQAWDQIAKELPGRNARQVRDRYKNYLLDSLISDPWTEEEDQIIMEKYEEFGAHWVKIAKVLGHRSGNDVKNRWHKHLSKRLSKEDTKEKSSQKVQDSCNQPSTSQKVDNDSFDCSSPDCSHTTPNFNNHVDSISRNDSNSYDTSQPQVALNSNLISNINSVHPNQTIINSGDIREISGIQVGNVFYGSYPDNQNHLSFVISSNPNGRISNPCNSQIQQFSLPHCPNLSTHPIYIPTPFGLIGQINSQNNQTISNFNLGHSFIIQNNGSLIPSNLFPIVSQTISQGLNTNQNASSALNGTYQVSIIDGSDFSDRIDESSSESETSPHSTPINCVNIGSAELEEKTSPVIVTSEKPSGTSKSGCRSSVETSDIFKEIAKFTECDLFSFYEEFEHHMSFEKADLSNDIDVLFEYPF
ncbi:hypothetical protein TRFO_10558 [Tritrichomonas foetus]|uniref:Myb-like DNA-binding domain containing protein n=1 Tax=Tritrichomonas foetus TaxID=1144522 RepID=A0A1J4JCM6_9EUKA|nr:hypothetical protein TRFO_10558 [Tritrichomonas foetus]|eukprot:OHS95411.1 hypothetical protein TRFO_10558 [Tritrichomonas foetus]